MSNPKVVKTAKCMHIIDGVNGPRDCDKVATHIIDTGNGDEYRCTKHFYTAISRAMKHAKAGDPVRMTFANL